MKNSRVSCAIWSRTREVDRHFVNQTCFFALPTQGSPVMQRARHLALPFALTTRLRQSRAAFERETFETQQRIGRETKEERRRQTRASND